MCQVRRSSDSAALDSRQDAPFLSLGQDFKELWYPSLLSDHLYQTRRGQMVEQHQRWTEKEGRD